jgi:hypothetical protein
MVLELVLKGQVLVKSLLLLLGSRCMQYCSAVDVILKWSEHSPKAWLVGGDDVTAG